MSKSMEIIFGFTVIAIVVAGFVFAGISLVPNETEVQAARTVTDSQLATPKDVTQMKVFDKIKNLDRNGNLPVVIDPAEIGKNNPFSPM